MTPDIPGYRIQRELGKGGMGMVYLATRLVDDTSIALKVLPPHLLNPVTTRRFQREGHALKSVDHPNVVKVFEVAARDGHHFIAMEYVRGRPLSSLVKDHPHGLPLREAFVIAAAIARALGAIHRKSMTHRDLKPGNVMVTPEGEVKLLDFGLVQLDGLTMLTATGNIIGTPTYMSPEQCSGLPLDPRTDIYAFGTVFFELLCGITPFSSEAVYELLEMQRKTPAPSPRKFRSEIPGEIEQVVLRCLEKRMEDRPQRIDEVLAVLGAEEQAEPGDEAPLAEFLASARKDKQARPPRQSSGLGLLFMLGLLLTGGAGYVLRSESAHAQRWRDHATTWWSDLTREQDKEDLRNEVRQQYANLSTAESLFKDGQLLLSRELPHEALQKFVLAHKTYPGRVEYLHAIVELQPQLGRLPSMVAAVRSHLAKGGSDPGARLAGWLQESP